MKLMRLIALVISLFITSQLHAGVFINEVFINPPDSDDDFREFIEFMGTPGMKLDGYAVAVASGTEQKFYPLNSIPPLPALIPEIDELFSLDGLSLGANGLLVIGIGTITRYPTLLTDSNFQRWTTLWNGGLDTTGKLSNDGSNTIFLLRNRPGNTQANPSSPLGLRWGKDIDVDRELFTPVSSTVCSGGSNPGTPCANNVDCLGGGSCVAGDVDQFGDGNLDKGQVNGLGGNTLDLKGASTLADITDDLEVVDEVSYEHTRGWEYDTDERHVDLGSTNAGLPERHVHSLDDMQNFNADVMSRVDYRTKGAGWTPVSGATGEQGNGNNWQDTATEQWIRGESLPTAGPGSGPPYYFDNTANADPNAIQPYMTNVPVWLADASGTDYDFTTSLRTYQIMAGRVNPLAITFIPGDSDRDGDCDTDDITKIATVFGDDNWIFSNSFADAPETDTGDPATQIRPWDVDATGNNGIEPSDLQWTLNFQGNTDGHVVGVRYDSTTPSATGIYLNSNAAVTCTVTSSTLVLSGRPLNQLKVGDLVELTVSAEVTGGANTTPAQENGVMQFVNDLAMDTAGVVRVSSIQSLGSFTTSRSSIQALQGTSGDLGVLSINGYTTNFSQGLGGAAGLYRVTLQAIGLGSTNATVSASTLAKFVASTPQGLKVGHTNNNGNPASAGYPSAIALTVTTTVKPDFDLDGDVDAGTGSDLEHLLSCRTRASVPQTLPGCLDARLDGDNDVDMDDFAIYQRCYSDEGGTPPQNCDQ